MSLKKNAFTNPQHEVVLRTAGAIAVVWCSRDHPSYEKPPDITRWLLTSHLQHVFLAKDHVPKNIEIDIEIDFRTFIHQFSGCMALTHTSFCYLRAWKHCVLVSLHILELTQTTSLGTTGSTLASALTPTSIKKRELDHIVGDTWWFIPRIVSGL